MYKALIIVAGDGTINYIMNVLAERKKKDSNKIKPYPIFVLPGGTGNDFYASIGGNLSNQNKNIKLYNFIKKLKKGTPRQIDLGHVIFTDENGKK